MTDTTEMPAIIVAHQMVDMVMENRAKNKKNYGFLLRTLSKRSFIMEHCTLKLSFPRQMGNSTAAAHVSKMLGIKDTDERSGAVLVPYPAQVNTLKRYGAQRVFSITDVRERKFKCEDLASVVVDCAVHTSPGMLDEIVDMMNADKGGWLVLIG